MRSNQIGQGKEEIAINKDERDTIMIILMMTKEILVLLEVNLVYEKSIEAK